jgi:hypothetical protein
MTAVRPEHAAARSTVDVAVTSGADLTAGERAQMLGVVHALKSLGLEVADAASPVGAPVHIAFSTLAGLDAATRPAAAAPPIVWPLPRVSAEVPAWVAAKDRVRAFWTASPELAERLRSAGAAATCIGLSCQLGSVRHAGRRARSVREQDFVFAAVVDERIPERAIRTLQRAWDRRIADPAQRFATTSLLASVGSDAQLAAWRRWANRPEAGTVVVERRSNDPASLTTLAELADGEILFGAATAAGLSPSWTAAVMLLRRKPVVALGDVGAMPFGGAPPPHLLRVDADDVDGLGAAMQSVLDSLWFGGDPGLAADCADGARLMMSWVSARALAVRAVDALRALGAWDQLVRADRS